MKKYWHIVLRGMSLLLPAALIAAGCDKTSRLPEKPELDTGVSELLFPMSGGEQTVSFETNRDWTAMVDTTLISPDVSWCSISASDGVSGKNTLTVIVDGMEGDYREAKLILNASAAGKVIRIMQSGIPIVTTAAPTEITESGALLSMTWQYAGEISISDAGFALKESSSAEFTDLSVEGADVPGTYTLSAEGLEASASYVVKAYVVTSDGSRYEGGEQTFVTAEAPETVPISDVKALGRSIAIGGTSTVSDNLIIEGTVIASYVEPETPEAGEPSDETRSVSIGETKIVVVDGTGKDCGITLKLETGTNVYSAGDKVSVRVKDGVLDHTASGAVYLSPLASGITVLSSGNSFSPVTVSHTELADYESMYVTVENTQILESYSDLATWSSSPVLAFEVSGSDKSYDVCVPATSEIGADAPSLLSGSLSGIVVSDDVSSYLLMAAAKEDVASLTEDRFASLLVLYFLDPVFSGGLYVGEEISGSVVRIEYRNGDGSVIKNVSATVSGDAAEGISVVPVSDVTVTGSGYIDLVVEGSPVAEGEVIFTVSGIEGLENASCTAVVEQPYVPEIGNFETYWSFSAHGNAVSIPYAENTNAAGVSVTSMDYVGDAGNISAAKWKDDWGANGWDANTSADSPSQYYVFTMTVAQGHTLDLSGMELNFRINGGDITLHVQYSVNGAAFQDAYTALLTGDSDTDLLIGLGTLPEMTGISEGATVTFRIVPVGTNATTKWGLKKGDRSFSVYGNVN